MEEITIKVEGMACTGCENRIKNALKQIEGIESANANYNTGIVEIKSKVEVSLDAIKETIEDLGFKVMSSKN